MWSREIKQEYSREKDYKLYGVKEHAMAILWVRGKYLPKNPKLQWEKEGILTGTWPIRIL